MATKDEPVGGISLGQGITVAPASDRHRDMYGGAVRVRIVSDRQTVALDLDADAATLVATLLGEAVATSRAAYAARPVARAED